MRRKKYLYFESKDQTKFQKTIESYNKSIENPKKGKDGSILMGVCRGRLSEGIDFKDRKARLVIIVGVPFPLFKDPKTLLKRLYLDEKKKML